ncbi:pseudoazurin (plasmid) [Martelella lutilitoris]|uniref:Pseudoazurin n=1 Tax=Martelella lutilitoris TaxID=2583532 RepID=A0A7T7HPK3_9HYPH|nr:pseudoazurin [Martelella lutilitoris]QQM32878.1 pseudoazurin [Martelella lutilitoris]QRX65029.1 pseudoazurin [Dysgonomonadaceae bacterium zrk40]
MFRIFALSFLVLTTTMAPVRAADHVVNMLNRGDDGIMVFEPGLLVIEPGDTVRFVAADRGHNAETIDGMVPEGAAGFEGRLNEEVLFSPDTEGVYAIKCKPHYAMGMVMIIAVGDVQAPDGLVSRRVPPRARKRFEAYLDAL